MFFQRNLGLTMPNKRQEEDEDGQLKADAETQNDGKEEAGVLLDGDDGVEFAAEAEDENLERAGQDEEVAEACAGKKETDGGRHEGNDEALLFLIEAGRDEEPHLIEDEGRSDEWLRR